MIQSFELLNYVLDTFNQRNWDIFPCLRLDIMNEISLKVFIVSLNDKTFPRSCPLMKLLQNTFINLIILASIRGDEVASIVILLLLRIIFILLVIWGTVSLEYTESVIWRGVGLEGISTESLAFRRWHLYSVDFAKLRRFAFHFSCRICKIFPVLFIFDCIQTQNTNVYLRLFRIAIKCWF